MAVVETGNALTSFSASVLPGTFFVRVRAQSGGVLGPASNEVMVVVPGGCAAPAAPGNLTGTVSGSLVQLAWQAAAGATTYVLEAGSAPGSNNVVASDLGGPATVLGASAPPGTYYVRVRARNACGTSGPSNEIVVVVGGCQPPDAAPTLTVTVAGRTVSLSWSPVGGATGYQLEAGESPGASNAAVVGLGAGTTLVTGAPPGLYYVRVRARNACGVGPVSNEIVVPVN